ncbi:MAG: glycosyl transferase [Chloroflexi bacterium]|nr:glycosyl transferase [Chloroflexota bacterium]
MSKAVFFSLPAHGHVNPSLSLVDELVKRGEQVIYYTSPEFKHKVEQTGAQFRDYGEKLESLNRELEGRQGNLIYLSACFLRMCQVIIPETLALLKTDRPDYIIYDSMAIWGRIIAKKMNLPAVCSITTFVMGEGQLPNPQILLSLIKDMGSIRQFNDLSKQVAAEFNITPIRLKEMFTNEADLNIVYTSTFFQPNAHQIEGNYKFIGPSIAARNERDNFDFPENKPLVYISLGTVFNNNLEFYNECFKAFENTGYQVVLSVGKQIDIDALKNIPANFIVRRHVPQLEVLQKASLFITHGGMNSVNEALFFGVPLIVIPMSVDQPIVASRVRELGAGIYLEKRKANHRNLKKFSGLILADERYKNNSKVIGDSFRKSGGHRQGVDEIFAYKNLHP